MSRVIDLLRQKRQEFERKNPDLSLLSTLKLHIITQNNFPTAAGLASSASGFSCLAFALAKFYQLPLSNSDISIFARIGSGSACRSLYGGFVLWDKGQATDGSDSMAVQVAPASHWPQIEALILIVSDSKKHTSSTNGMQTTVQTSNLLKYRLEHTVPTRIADMKTAIINKDFDTFAEITMRDSNEFHAVCMDTFPPISYLTNASHAVIRLISIYNNVTATNTSKYKAAYTFDAGPNPVIFTLKQNTAELINLINYFFPHDGPYIDYFGPVKTYMTPSPKELMEEIEKQFSVQPEGAFKRMISATIGEEPRVLGNEDSLADAYGQPKK
jgi:diphosphomevalonate decarboxylase